MDVFKKLLLAVAHAYLFGVHNRADRDRVKDLYDEANATSFPSPGSAFAKATADGSAADPTADGSTAAGGKVNRRGSKTGVQKFGARKRRTNR